MRRRLTISLTFAALVALTLTACGGEVPSSENGPDEYADRMAAEHADDVPTAGLASTEGTEDAPVSSETVTYATVAGKAVRGYLARPEGTTAESGLPGIIVIHEWWGLNDNVETMARMLARQGYVALAVDLYGGKSAETPAGARTLMSSVDESAAEDNLRQAYAYLAKDWSAPRVGVIGWCFGGGWSLRAALLLSEKIDATVIYYGRLVTERDRLATLDMPILGIFGAEDQGIPVEGVREFESTLKELGKPATIHVYEGAGHAFANPSGQRYRPEAAKDAWQKTVAFFAQHLQKQGS